jgi:hypothetical protein
MLVGTKIFSYIAKAVARPASSVDTIVRLVLFYIVLLSALMAPAPDWPVSRSTLIWILFALAAVPLVATLADARRASWMHIIVSLVLVLIIILSALIAANWPESYMPTSMIWRIVGRVALIALLFGLAVGVFGAALLLLVVAMLLGCLGFGVAPPQEVAGSRSSRWILAALSILVVEVQAEDTPPGSWTVNVLEREKSAGEVHGLTPVHAIYDDPRAHDALVRWLETSSHAVALSRER